MTLLQRIQTAGRVFLDTAPMIFAIEKHPLYAPLLTDTFRAIDIGEAVGVTSPITLAECLVQPMRAGRNDLVKVFTASIVRGANVQFLQVDLLAANAAARIRAQHNLSLTDAIQIAIAIGSGCPVFLTNDLALRRVREVEILMLDDFLSDAASA